MPDRGLWFHVDAAYGARCALRPERAPALHRDRARRLLVVDPHKWLDAPFDSCALVYREPGIGRAVTASTRSTWTRCTRGTTALNPADYGDHLARRPRGLPFWYSLAVHGTALTPRRSSGALALTRRAAEEIRSRDELELLAEPELSVLVFRRRGWQPEDYAAWAEALRITQTAFVLPTTHEGETVARLALVNPRTTLDDAPDRARGDPMCGG